MNAKTRIQQLEKERGGKVVLTWKEFIDWTNGKVFDAETEARLQKEWAEFVAKAGGDK